jgi:hypothetical protein
MNPLICAASVIGAGLAIGLGGLRKLAAEKMEA